jgi:uncharacterized membrane protein YgcG
MTSIIILILLHLSFLSIIKTEIIPICETLKDIQGDSSVKLRRASALCDDLEASRGIADQEDSDLIPDFDLNQIDSGNIYEQRKRCEILFLENDVNQILKRFRRGRSSSSSGGRSSSSGSRFSSSSSRSSSSGGSRFFGGEIF